MDTHQRHLRYHVVEELVLLAASGDAQVEFLNRTGSPYMELLKGYLNWSSVMLPQLERQGVLSPEVVVTTSAVTEALFELDADFTVEYEQTKRIEGLSKTGIRQDPRWGVIRGLAREAIAAFGRLGLVAPDLLDGDYNARRDETP